MTECLYCGNDHAPTDLCRARRVSRRLFCFAAGAAAVGACLPAPPLGAADWTDGQYAVINGLYTVPHGHWIDTGESRPPGGYPHTRADPADVRGDVAQFVVDTHYCRVL